MPRRVAFITLLADRLCLDLVNSANWIDGQVADEAFASVDDVVAWASRALPMSAGGLDDWKAALSADPQAAEQLPARLRACRDTIRRLCLAGIDPGASPAGLQPDLDALFALNAGAPVRLVAGEAGFRCEPAGGAPDGWLLGLVARSATELLLGPDRSALRLCPGHRCGWLFLDRSRSGLRRWCQMETCGNRAKARAHHRRAQGPQDRSVRE
ncbi:MAG: CGNR zinc finger domain-containing protein [Rhizobiales bacterium]|nr:CGNR zinc finger domain-containing protein [Hyphomicrobiales bacterium]